MPVVWVGAPGVPLAVPLGVLFIPAAMLVTCAMPGCQCRSLAIRTGNH